MVQTGVAAAGSALLAGGVGLMVASALMESFVIVTVPGAPDCDVDNLGNLGIFTASYDPKCTESHPDPSVAALYKKVEKLESVPTTEFPLLFASQEGLPMLADDLEFTDCETFWAEGSPAENAAFSAAQTQVIDGVEAGMRQAGAIVAGIPKQLSAFGPLVTELWKDVAEDATEQVGEIKELDGLTLDMNTLKGIAEGTIAAIECGTGTTDSCEAVFNSEAPPQVANALSCDCTDPVCQGKLTAVAQSTVSEQSCPTFQSFLKTKTAKGALVKVVNASDTTQGAALDVALFCCTETPLTPTCKGTIAQMAKVDASSVDEGNCQQLSDAIFAESQVIVKADPKTVEKVMLLTKAKNLFRVAILGGQGTANFASAVGNGIYSLPSDFQANDDDGLCIMLALDSFQDPSERKYDYPDSEKQQLGEFLLGTISSCPFKLAINVLAANAAKLIPDLLAGISLKDSPIPQPLVSELVVNLLQKLADCANGDATAPGTTGCVQAVVYGKDQTDFPSGLNVTGGISEDLTGEDFFARVFDKQNVVGGLSYFGEFFEEGSDERKAFDAAAGLFSVCLGAAQGNPLLAKKTGCLGAYNQGAYTLINGLTQAITSSFQSALNAIDTVNCTDPSGPPTLNAVVSGLNSKGANLDPTKSCVDLITDAKTYIAKTTAAPKYLYNSLVSAATASVLGDSTTNALRIESCNDDSTDKKIFETAQKMVPASIALAGLGMLVSFAAVGTQKKLLAILGGLLGVLGGGVLLGALLYVKSAPVYALVGGDKVDGKAFYQGGLAQTLALGGIFGPILGGLLVLGSSFCGGSSESSALTTGKVDGTY